MSGIVANKLISTGVNINKIAGGKVIIKANSKKFRQDFLPLELGEFLLS